MTRAVREGALLAILGIGLAACGRHETRTAEVSASPARDVRTADVVRSGGMGEAAVPGTVQARHRAVLSTRMLASVVDLPFREGERVAAGAVVVRLDDAAVRAAVAAAEASAKAAEADLERTKALVDQGIVAARELERAIAFASAARAQLTAARDTLAYSALRAPFASRVAARLVNLGDVVSPGMPLVELEGEDGLELRATVESKVAVVLLPGVTVRAIVDGQAQPLAATVTAVAPSGDPTTHRFELRADLPDAPGLRAGLFARLLVSSAGVEPRLTVPASALLERGGLTGLFVVDDGKARLRWVAAGARDGGRVEIEAGVEAGERVALDPSGLVDGAAVAAPRIAER